MALKRKRSSPSLPSTPTAQTSWPSPCALSSSSSSSPSSFSSCSTTPSPQSAPLPSFYHQSKPNYSIPFAPKSDLATSLSSRTMKRHRDNRPSEAEVQRATLRKLFEAQRREVWSPGPVEMDETAAGEQLGEERGGEDMEVEGQMVLDCQEGQRRLEAFWGR
ncbi:hypothetical protein CAC42_396 [Sphaceloma murrayae]|uniref:Uncharacterized protein n=1 Tax=Sphaceloma murrayae TaxID=2082308 RepID=A0A2K1R3F2_9PEZI|nr:hypothetical protein CAC42_396 [Sphaceloma murrayae]